MIYTSYFGNLKKIPPHIIPIAICGKSPTWYNGLEYKTFAPKIEFFNKWKISKDNDYYIKCYKEQVLEDLSLLSVLRDLSSLSNNKDIVLLCYEKPNDFCHRHLVSEWFRSYNINCIEFLGE